MPGNNRYPSADPTSPGSSPISILPTTNESIKIAKFPEDIRIEILSFSPTNKYIAFGSDINICLWEWQYKPPKPPQPSILTSVLTALHILSPVSPAPEKKFIILPNIDEKIVKSISFSPDENYVAAGFQEGFIKIWCLYTFKLINSFQAHNNSINSILWINYKNRNEYSQYIISGSSDKTIKIWLLNTNMEVRLSRVFGKERSKPAEDVLANPLRGRPRSGAAEDRSLRKTAIQMSSNDSEKLLSALKSISSNTKKNVIASGSSRDPPIPNGLQRHLSTIESISYSTEKKIIASGSYDSSIILWDFNTFRFKERLGTDSPIRCLDISDDGNYIVYGTTNNNNNNINIWTYNRITKNWDDSFLEGHAGLINSVSISPHGSIIVSGSADGTIKVWNNIVKRCIKTFDGRTAQILSSSVSDDNIFIASGSANGTIKVWNMPQIHRILVTPSPGSGALKRPNRPRRPHTLHGSGKKEKSKKLIDTIKKSELVKVAKEHSVSLVTKDKKAKTKLQLFNSLKRQNLIK